MQCSDCGSMEISKHKIRNTMRGTKDVFRCKRCKSIFTPGIFPRMRYDDRTIIIALNLFNEGFSYGNIKEYLSDRDINVRRSTIYRWIKKFSKI